MAPIELDTHPSYIPAGLLVTHIFSIGVTSFVVGRSLYRSYVALPPSSATRHREPLRRDYVQVFSALALLSLVASLFYSSKFASLSYRVWAAERGIDLPESIFGDTGALRGGEHPGRLHIVRWLNDVTFYRDHLEIIAEKARHFWWGQQVNLGLVSWSMYLAIEGQRRKISNLWAFLALSQLVNLSYAQNLFFVAVLLTPVPLPENVRELAGESSWFSDTFQKVIPSKPDGFLPKPALYITLLLINYAFIFLIPLAANTTSFMTISVLSRAIPFSFLALPYLIPISWGTTPTHPHAAHTTYKTLFRIISVMSIFLHLKSTAIALFSNTPESTYYRHSLLHPFKEEHRSTFDRGTTAVSRVFGAILEHPAVGYDGWDVILSGLSLGIWAAIRGLDVKEMLESSIPFLKQTAKASEGAIAEVKDSVIEAQVHPLQAIKLNTNNHRLPSPPSSTRPRRLRKKVEKFEDSDTITISEKPRRRGRPRKTLTSDDTGDTLYQPPPSVDQVEEGDEEADDDWEVAALAWGLLAVGGIGSGSAGVYGAEVLGR